ncbi:hypothetical protein QJQ45_024296, partial [Haematococcus lacustris]
MSAATEAAAATESAAATEATAATEAAAATEAKLEEARSQLRSCQSVNMRTATDLQVCQERLHQSQQALQQSENEVLALQVIGVVVDRAWLERGVNRGSLLRHAVDTSRQLEAANVSWQLDWADWQLQGAPHQAGHPGHFGLMRTAATMDSTSLDKFRSGVAGPKDSECRKIININEGETGSFMSAAYKPAYAFQTDRTLSDLPSKMEGSLFSEDLQLHANKKHASGLWQLAICSSPGRHQFGSGFFLSQQFSLNAELQTLFKWRGISSFDRYTDVRLCVHFSQVFRNEGVEGPMFMAEVAATPIQHVFTPPRLYKLLARPSEPRYENVSTKMDSPRLAIAAGQGFRPLPEDISTGADRSADFVIGILPCHDLWFKRMTPTAVQSMPPYFFVPSATPAVPSGDDIMVATGYPWLPMALALANTLSASAGDVIAVGRAQIKHRCSTAPGMSGGPVWPLHAPCTFKAIHCGSSGTENRAYFNHAYNVHDDLFVLNYVCAVCAAGAVQGEPSRLAATVHAT